VSETGSGHDPRERVRYLESVLGGLGEGVVHIRPDRTLEPLNEAAWELLGVSREELHAARVGDGPWSLRHPEGGPYPPERTPWARGLAGEEVTNELVGVATGPGPTRWLRMTTRLVGEPGGVVASYQDVTESYLHQRTVVRLRAVERLVAGLSTRLVHVGPDEVDDAILGGLEQLAQVIDIDRAYVFSAPDDDPDGALDQTHVWAGPGIDDHAAVRRGVDGALMPWWMGRVTAGGPIVVTDVRRLPPEAEMERRVFVSQQVQALVSVPMIADDIVLGFIGLDSCRGPRQWDDDVIRLLRLVGEAFAGALLRRRTGRELSAAHDLLRSRNAELEALNERLLEASRVKDEFLSVTSHELRTPLTTIRGIAETLLVRHGNLTGPSQADLLDALARQAGRLERLVDDLLVTSRLAADAVRVRPETVVVVPFLRALVGAGEDHDATVTGDEAAAARVDPDHLARMVENLLQNAARYGRPPVEVHVARSGEKVAVTVRDHGPGVPASFREQLFERFTQASAGTRREARGTGLGLSIVRDLARLNGGEVAHEDADPGARFVVVLPSA
jgi:signal transduction histidine kinase